ncbi:hypothetical protein FACS1894122_09830 [Alphaproteobacteria bacterium]|nr:hypothetical protein FACS1894122_09830 [Alphaproteobacteria bacterium]
MDFNTAEAQTEFALIPEGTIAKAMLVIKPGNDVDPFLTRSKNSDSAYLDCEYAIIEGRYAKHKIFDKIGVEGSDAWVNIGRSRIRAILESAKNINPKDVSETAMAARKIKSFNELNRLEVVIKIGIEIDKGGVYKDKNRVVSIITPDNSAYKEHMNNSDGIPWSM